VTIINEFQNKFKVNKYLIYSSQYWNWSLRPHQSTCGSGILSLKRECSTFSGLEPEEFDDLKYIVNKIENTLKSIFNYDIINYLMLMMEDNQVHFHVFPRYRHKIKYLEKTWTDKNWPKIPDLKGEPLSDDKLQIINSNIKQAIKSKLEPQSIKKYKIGYTTGVFDLFHVGHLNILKNSKNHCDYLVVGVSTDELVLDYKGKRPLIPFEERIEIVKAITYVDEVVPQLTIDKYMAWQKIKFDVIFHGDDWKNSKLYSSIENKFKSLGVDMMFFEYTKGTTSSALQKFVLGYIGQVV